MKLFSTQGHFAPKAKKPSKRVSQTKILILAIIAVSLMILDLCLLGYSLQLKQAREEFQQLSATVQASQSPTVAATLPQTAPTETTAETTEPATLPTEPPVKSILPQYVSLYEENPDLFGWITIPDTAIDYPVMHTPADPEKYLHANFDGKYSYGGTPFLDASCTGDSDNLLIYAHNMLDGSMFRSLIKYEQKDYWKKHPVITFNTLYDEQEYEVLAAFYDRVYLKTETCFKFYQFIDAADEEAFDQAVRQFQEKSLYDTCVTASYGDQLITLVTCAYHTENGRFVVIARKATEPPV